MSITLFPLIPLVFILIIFSSAIFLTLYLYLRRFSEARRIMLILLILRTMVILSLMLIFIGLSLHFTYSSKKIRPLVVILDISPSMNYLLEVEGKTRFE
ncbi:MAG: hypothetical protein B6D57_03940, partial [Candidatus Coatesbacteria bacterium 4484_99]